MRRLICSCLLLSGCTSWYSVRSSDLSRGMQLTDRGERDVAVPAFAYDGRPTNVEVRKVAEVVPGPAGRSYVSASDPRLGCKIAGWYFTIPGIIVTGIGAAHFVNAQGADDLGLAVAGGVYLLLGGTFLTLGYKTDGPEEPHPTPGFEGG